MSTPGCPSPRTVTTGLRQQAWWVIRKRRYFTLQDLLETVANGAEKDASSNLGKYVRALEKAGIVKREARPPAGGAMPRIRYRLVVDAGRKAPVWRAVNSTVYDPNSGAIYPLGGRDE